MRVGLIVAALLAPGVAAADLQKPQIAPPPAWVVPTPLPSLDGKPGDAPVAILLRDQQLRLSPDGDQTYVETIVRVQTPEGLNAMGTVALPWKPDNGPLTLHKLRILRAGKEIDLLKDGSGITVLRRENNLELATLDGVLTAVVQVEGLQINDVLDMALTTTSRDPVLAGHSEGAVNAASPVPIGEVRLRAIWDAKTPIRWRTTEAVPAPRESRHDGLVELSVRADNVQPPLLPKGAPARFAQVGYIEFTGFKAWADLSALFAPLYAKAETLKAESPLKAEIARIAADSPDPIKRTEAALALVQNQIRYFNVALADGGLRPADADVTWDRRFADCKGKTVLLLALLHGLGVSAEPAIVSSRFGDGLEQRLPTAGSFDHIIVRATIAGKTYWLDGTRIGDRRLADIEVPPFRWALPVRTAGAALEQLIVPPLTRPTKAMIYTLDLTAGITKPAPFHVEEITRGDMAQTLKTQIANLTPDVRDRALREYMKAEYPKAVVKGVTARFDDATGQVHIVMDGTLTHDWDKHWYYPQRSGLAFDADFERVATLHKDAPFSVAYPIYVTTDETVKLPGNGEGFEPVGTDLLRTIAGVEYRRASTKSGPVYHIATSERSIAPEFPASEAAANQTALRALSDDDAALKLTGAYRRTSDDLEALLVTDPKTADDYFRRGHVRFGQHDYASAIAEFDKALALDPKLVGALVTRGFSKLEGRKQDYGLADFDAAIAIDDKAMDAHGGRARVMLWKDRRAEAVADLDKELANNPDFLPNILLRAQVNESLDHHEQALADTERALKLSPMAPEALFLRVQIFKSLKRTDKAAAEAMALADASPPNARSLVIVAPLFLQMGRPADARRLYDRAIAIEPSADAYVGRARTRMWNDFDGRRADLDAALKLKPTFDNALMMKVENEIVAKAYDAAITTASQILDRTPTFAAMLADRAVAYALSGKTALAAQDFAAARRAATGDAEKLNNLCWTKATYAVVLESALEDCDAALKLAPDAAPILDSRGMVLLRLGRYAEAIGCYDRALAKAPKMPASLYGRGIAKRRANRASDGDADIASAKEAAPGIDDQFAAYGLAG